MQETEPELEKNEETEERCEGQDFKKKIKGGQRKKNQNSHWRSYVFFYSSLPNCTLALSSKEIISLLALC